jgi:hypothetical protein
LLATGQTGNILDGTVDAVQDLVNGVGGAVVDNLKRRGITDGVGSTVDGVVAPLVPIVNSTSQAVGEIVGAVSFVLASSERWGPELRAHTPVHPLPQTGNIVSGTVGAVGDLLDGVTGTVLGNL